MTDKTLYWARFVEALLQKKGAGNFHREVYQQFKEAIVPENKTTKTICKQESVDVSFSPSNNTPGHHGAALAQLANIPLKIHIVSS